MTKATTPEIVEMCQQTIDMLALAWQGFRKQETGPFATAAKLGREIHQREKALTPVAGERFFVPMHLERIGDNVEALVGAVQTMLAEGVPFTDRAIREVNGLFEQSLELLECVRDAVATGNRVLIHYVTDHAPQLAQLADDYALAHQRRLVEGVCMPRASSIYLAMLDHLKGVEWHMRQIALKLAPGASPSPP